MTSPPCSSSVVRLNVGGWRHETSLLTLRSQPDGMLARMFSEEWTPAVCSATASHHATHHHHGGGKQHHTAANFQQQQQQDEKHGHGGRLGPWGPQQQMAPEVFIDRDGRHFHTVLNFLRDGPNVAMPEARDALNQLLREAEYYQLSGLQELCRQRLHTGTRLIRPNEVVRWRHDCVDLYWKSFAMALAQDGIEFGFLFDKVGKKYQDRQTTAICIGCLAKFNLDQVTVFNFTVRFEEWQGLKHHMLEMRGLVQEIIGTTCCVIVWGNGKRLHLPNTAIIPAD